MTALSPRYCRHLKKVSLLHAAALTDAAITYIADSLPKLTYLALEGSCLNNIFCGVSELYVNGFQRCYSTGLLTGNHNITGASIKLLGRGCPDLVYLFLADCFQMCDNGLKVKSGSSALTLAYILNTLRR